MPLEHLPQQEPRREYTEVPVGELLPGDHIRIYGEAKPVAIEAINRLPSGEVEVVLPNARLKLDSYTEKLEKLN